MWMTGEELATKRTNNSRPVRDDSSGTAMMATGSSGYNREKIARSTGNATAGRAASEKAAGRLGEGCVSSLIAFIISRPDPKRTRAEQFLQPR